MAGELEAVVRTMFAAFDREDYAGALRTAASGIQAVDELSGQWLRTQKDLTEYMQQLEGVVSNIHSDLSDMHEVVYGDVGIFTCWLDQDYMVEGEEMHISAPTTVVLHREGGAWKIVLFHSIPLAEDDEDDEDEEA